MKKVEVVLTGRATCTFVRKMMVREDELEDLLNDDDTIACNLDDPSARFDIDYWDEVEAVKQG